MPANSEGFANTALPGAETVASSLDVTPVLDSLTAQVQAAGEGVVIPHEDFASFYHS